MMAREEKSENQQSNPFEWSIKSLLSYFHRDQSDRSTAWNKILPVWLKGRSKHPPFLSQLESWERGKEDKRGRLFIISHNPVKVSVKDKLNLHRLTHCEMLLTALMISRSNSHQLFIQVTLHFNSSPTAKQNLFTNSSTVISFLCVSSSYNLWPHK